MKVPEEFWQRNLDAVVSFDVDYSRFSNSKALAKKYEQISAVLKKAANGEYPKLSESNRYLLVLSLENAISHRFEGAGQFNISEEHQCAAQGTALALAKHDGPRGENPFWDAEVLGPAYFKAQQELIVAAKQ
ncbi:hypothetical protein [Janthinobacterium sp. MDT1-19]|uniref:hypothetical protein n=1 Tax=Janthinobacterium sp. MDT1-19 TaxID=1259339 RepID=UPI003F270FAA